jgi:hypothetical protein
MGLGIAFWVLMLLWVCLRMWSDYNSTQPFFRWGAGNVLLFALLLVLGWGLFGPPINDTSTPPRIYQRR